MTTTSSPTTDTKAIPKRPLHNPRLSVDSVSIVGLGCSSFSTFFWSDDDWKKCKGNANDDDDRGNQKTENFTIADLTESHPIVQEWIDTICYAVLQADINLLDTAPWYGHGISETVVGWALKRLCNEHNMARSVLVVNTKVGRYEMEPSQQFDFSHDKTIASVKLSLQRLQQRFVDENGNGYIDVIQLHDPEFAPNMDLLFEETIPALLKCRDEYGWCRSLGMTGYPLGVQHQILQRSLEEFPNNIWDQSLTYAHYTMHDTSLVNRTFVGSPNSEKVSFATFCETQIMTILSAAPLSMGLLTHQGPPDWHPASNELKTACQTVAKQCQDNDMDVTHLATVFALSEPRIPCTILGMKDIAQVQAAQRAAARISALTDEGAGRAQESGAEDASHPSLSRLKPILTSREYNVLTQILDPVHGPFSKVWENGHLYCSWDGIAPVHDFWKDLNVEVTKWQVD